MWKSVFGLWSWYSKIWKKLESEWSENLSEFLKLWNNFELLSRRTLLVLEKCEILKHSFSLCPVLGIFLFDFLLDLNQSLKLISHFVLHWSVGYRLMAVGLVLHWLLLWDSLVLLSVNNFLALSCLVILLLEFTRVSAALFPLKIIINFF